MNKSTFTHPPTQLHKHTHIHLFELIKVVPVSQKKDVNSVVGVELTVGVSTELASAQLHLVG